MVPILGLCGVIFFIVVGAADFDLNGDVETSSTDLVKFSLQISDMLQILINVATINDKDVLKAVDIKSVELLFSETEKNLHIFHESLTNLLKLKKQRIDEESNPDVSETDTVPPDYYTRAFLEYAATSSSFLPDEIVDLSTESSTRARDESSSTLGLSADTEDSVAHQSKSEPSAETTGSMPSYQTKSVPSDTPTDKYKAFKYISDFLNVINEEDGSNSEKLQTNQHIEYEVVLQDRAGPIEDSDDDPLIIPVFGTPGQDFPDYNDIPETMFTCNFKDHIPGFYADLETGCQVFHGCWSRRMESFLCPTGTIFNQKIRACDYWFNTTCLSSPDYYHLNADLAERFPSKATDDESVLSEMSDELTYSKLFHGSLSFSDQAVNFIPILLKTTFYPKEMLTKNTPEFRKLKEFFRRDPEAFSDSEDISPKKRSKLEIEARARKLYPELFATSGPSTEETVQTTLKKNLFDNDSLLSKFKPRKTEILPKSKTNRSGHLAKEMDPKFHSTESYSTETTITPTVGTESYGSYSTSEDPRETKTKTNFYREKEDLAPVIVSKVFETVDTVFNRGIMPLTKDILANSYSALLKKGKKN